MGSVEYPLLVGRENAWAFLNTMILFGPGDKAAAYRYVYPTLTISKKDDA